MFISSENANIGRINRLKSNNISCICVCFWFRCDCAMWCISGEEQCKTPSNCLIKIEKGAIWFIIDTILPINTVSVCAFYKPYSAYDHTLRQFFAFHIVDVFLLLIWISSHTHSMKHVTFLCECLPLSLPPLTLFLLYTTSVYIPVHSSLYASDFCLCSTVASCWWCFFFLHRVADTVGI